MIDHAASLAWTFADGERDDAVLSSNRTRP